MFTWKCHKETPCVAILNKQKVPFSLSFFFLYKIGEQKGGTSPAWVRLVLVGERRRWGNGEEW
jgi:hypothetical protein